MLRLRLPYVPHLLVLSALACTSINGAEYSIQTTWNNETISHPQNPVKVKLERNDAESFKITVLAPFFKDPAPSGPTPAGEPLYGLWDYEVVKVVLSNEKKQYVEVQLGAWGHHFVLLSNGYRQEIRIGMLIQFSATRTDSTWHGVAIIPLDYLPLGVNRMNMFASHGTGTGRVNEALYPVPNTSSGSAEDIVNSFQFFDVKIIRADDPSTFSSVWTDAMNGIRSFRVARTWDDKPIAQSDVVNMHFRIDVTKSALVLEVEAPFYNDPVVPDKQGGGSFVDLYKYEVVHLYLLAYPSLKYVEVELGPWGHYLVVFWNGYYNLVGSVRSPIAYNVTRSGGRWSGTAIIPLSYLPPQIYLMNAYSSHGVGAQRQHYSLYPIPQDKNNRTSPDFHLFQFYKFIDLSSLYPDNDSPLCSKIWEDISDCSTSSAGRLATNFCTVLFPFILFLNFFINSA